MNKYIALFIMMVCCSTAWSQNKLVVEFLEEHHKKSSIYFYENDAEDEFNVGITLETKKIFSYDLKLLFDADFANDFKTYSIKEFFVLDFNLLKSIGCFDVLLSIKNVFNYSDSEIINEPVLAQNNGISYLKEFEHAATFVAMLGVSYNF